MVQFARQSVARYSTAARLLRTVIELRDRLQQIRDETLADVRYRTDRLHMGWVASAA
jgi:hypothetical protein